MLFLLIIKFFIIKFMKNWKCKLGVHDYELIGNQNSNGIVSSFSMTSLTRNVKKCKRCGKVNFEGYDITTNAHLDETLDWQPKLNY